MRLKPEVKPLLLRTQINTLYAGKYYPHLPLLHLKLFQFKDTEAYQLKCYSNSAQKPYFTQCGIVKGNITRAKRTKIYNHRDQWA